MLCLLNATVHRVCVCFLYSFSFSLVELLSHYLLHIVTIVRPEMGLSIGLSFFFSFSRFSCAAERKIARVKGGIFPYTFFLLYYFLPPRSPRSFLFLPSSQTMCFHYRKRFSTWQLADSFNFSYFFLSRILHRDEQSGSCLMRLYENSQSSRNEGRL